MPFAQLDCKAAVKPPLIPHFDFDWLTNFDRHDVALVVDLPGENAIYFGLELLKLGFRPVPVIDGSPGPVDIELAAGLNQARVSSRPAITVDMSGLLRALCHAAGQLRSTDLAKEAPPAFLLDSKRMETVTTELESAYDNRWMAFPQDFPAGRFLVDHGIRKIVMVHDRFSKQPQDDLAHVLLRWQEKGIVIESKSTRTREDPVPIEVFRPDRYRAAWYRAIAALRLRRHDAGGFGGYPWELTGGG